MNEEYALGLQSKLRNIVERATQLESAVAQAVYGARQDYNLRQATDVYRPNQATMISSSGSRIAYDPNAVGVYNNNGQSLDKLKKTNTFELPGYDPAKMVIKTPDKTVEINFLMGINSLAQSRSNAFIQNKTSGGWFIYRLGSNLMQLNFTGNLLDTKEASEKAEFLSAYKSYIEDQKDSNNRFYNDNVVILYAQGFKYIGYVVGLNLTETADRLFLASYSMSMIVVKDVNVFNPNTARPNIKDNIVALVKPQDNLSQDINTILTSTRLTATE